MLPTVGSGLKNIEPQASDALTLGSEVISEKYTGLGVGVLVGVAVLSGVDTGVLSGVDTGVDAGVLFGVDTGVPVGVGLGATQLVNVPAVNVIFPIGFVDT